MDAQMDTESEIEKAFESANERAILKIVHDTLLDFAAFLSIRPGEIMQEIRSRLPKPLAVTDDRTPKELKRDGDDRWPDGSEYHPTFGKLPPMNKEDHALAESMATVFKFQPCGCGREVNTGGCTGCGEHPVDCSCFPEGYDHKLAEETDKLR